MPKEERKIFYRLKLLSWNAGSLASGLPNPCQPIEIGGNIYGYVDIRKEPQTLDDSNGVIINHNQELNKDKATTSYQCFPKKSKSIKYRMKQNPVNKCFKEERASDTFSDYSSDSRDNSSSSSSCSENSFRSSDKNQQENKVTHFEMNSENKIFAESRENMTGCLADKRCRKRLRCEETWQKVRNKLLKNSGKSYVSKSGRCIEGRKIKPPCTERCLLQCSRKISNEQREKIFQEFWELASLHRQRDFLSSCVELLDLKYRRISSTEPRKPNSAFYLHINGHKRRICKTFLINTLGIAERSLRTVIQAKTTGTGIVPEDGRGKHGRHKKVDSEVKKSVIDHINSIPRIESNRVRRDTTREFIDGSFSVSKLYRIYLEERSATKQPTASRDMYGRIFKTKFNIGFFVSKKGQ